MAGYRDWLNIDNPNNMGEEQLKKAIRSMGNAANKRLKRMENKDIYFGEDKGPDTTAGVKRFTVRGKSLDELKREFKRVRNFLRNPQSSLTGMKRVYKEFKERVRKLSRKEKKEYSRMKKQKMTSGMNLDKYISPWEELRRWRETWKYYNKLVDEGYYAPTEYDSAQVRDMILATIAHSYSESLSNDETWKILLDNLRNEYEESQDINDDYISTSSLINKGIDLGPSD